VFNKIQMKYNALKNDQNWIHRRNGKPELENAQLQNEPD
jgi:hypothetical protein